MIKFGFIGLDDITEIMCKKLVEGTNSIVYVYDLVIARSEYLAKFGAVPCEVITDVSERADIIFIKYRNSTDVQGAIYAILGGLRHSNIIIDMSPNSMEMSEQFANMIKDNGAEYVDAPVIKNGKTLEDIRITMLYGGTSNVYVKVSDYLKIIADVLVQCGDNTSGVCMYMCYAVLLTQIQNGVNEAVLLASKNGIFITEIIKAIKNSPAQNLFIQEYGENLVKNEFPRNITIDEIQNAISMAKDLAKKNSYSLKGLNLVNGIYESAIDRKLKTHDITELYSIMKRSSYL